MRLYDDGNNNENRYIMAKFKNKFRIESIRLPGYDYSQSGAYFITIVTKNREHFFGEIVNGKMELSEIGEIVKNEWQKTAEIREYVQLGEWVIMPNHFHAIVIIQNDNTIVVETHSNASLQCNASPQCNASLQQNGNQQYQNKFGPQSQN